MPILPALPCEEAGSALVLMAAHFSFEDVRLRSNALSGDVLPSAALLNAAGRHPRMAHLDLADPPLTRSEP
eukprot:2895064-Amphidinium_carterae.2